MAGVIIVLIIVALVALVIGAKWMANTALSVESPYSPGDASLLAERHFSSKLHRVERSGHDRTFTPRLKRDAPTLHVEISPSGQGSRVDMHAVYVVEKRGFMPWVPKHGLWIWRKQRKIQKSLTTAPQLATS